MGLGLGVFFGDQSIIVEKRQWGRAQINEVIDRYGVRVHLQPDPVLLVDELQFRIGPDTLQQQIKSLCSPLSLFNIPINIPY